MQVKKNVVEIWGGLEGTINRVGDAYHDQLEYCGHYQREGDIDLIASLGVSMVRYPVLWEKHQPQKDTIIDWSFVEKSLNRLRELNVEPIAGLVHHGSGPVYVNFFDGSFEEGVANYARMVAEKFPWLEYYTPINEPLTTARFCGLYGHWYPHKKDDLSFYTILLSECKATVMAMKAIREINPDAKLIQTEDLGKTYSTPLLKYQATFENHRRWISYDLLCGRVTSEHPLWDYLTQHVGLQPTDLHYFLTNNCTPHICGFNYYLTSERYLDHRLSKYPTHTHGGNGNHKYADVETVRVSIKENWGPSVLLKEAYEHLQLPIAVTECHLHCTREEQLRWFHQMWETVNTLKADGVDIRALTAWALFGLHGWNKLVTEPWGAYEPGVFNLSTGTPKPTALAELIQALTSNEAYCHPVLQSQGWWQRDTRIHYSGKREKVIIKQKLKTPSCQPLLIAGGTEVLNTAFSHFCTERNIHHIVINSSDADITNRETAKRLIQTLHPWAIINTSEYERIQRSRIDTAPVIALNDTDANALAQICYEHTINLVSFSCDGYVNSPKERANNNERNRYSTREAVAAKNLIKANPTALIIRTGNLFCLDTASDFISTTLASLRENRQITAAYNHYTSFTYVPDLVQETLNMLLDNEQGIFYVANDGRINRAKLALKIAEIAGFDKSLIQFKSAKQVQTGTHSPASVLPKEQRVNLAPLQDALERYVGAVETLYQAEDIAV